MLTDDELAHYNSEGYLHVLHSKLLVFCLAAFASCILLTCRTPWWGAQVCGETPSVRPQGISEGASSGDR